MKIKPLRLCAQTHKAKERERERADAADADAAASTTFLVRD